MSNELTDNIIKGIPDVLVETVGLIIEKWSDSDLATFIVIGSTGGKLEAHHNGYEVTKSLAEEDGSIRPDILQCVLYCANYYNRPRGAKCLINLQNNG